MNPTISKAVADQVAYPDHCYLELRDGVYFKHSMSDQLNPLRGQPVRFTKAAAQRMLKWALEQADFVGAKLVVDIAQDSK